ncbi:hypothetical protein KEF85_13545 [Methylomonas paludis]|uniref:Uncharacterized protein n=1 Tax=Methylomonas paludis TaxID=1173101 RepID=A0A975MRM2_9GAMM|nr:hypothetical protein [Methylomonas paludis]QWF72625.1 hypothetical protein KEF85_13545 [Methylomonas paludis]
MIYNTVHMRDQKANQLARISRTNKQAMLNLVEEIILVVVLWGMFFLTILS